MSPAPRYPLVGEEGLTGTTVALSFLDGKQAAGCPASGFLRVVSTVTNQVVRAQFMQAISGRNGWYFAQ
jgi:hypothetical protein